MDWFCRTSLSKSWYLINSIMCTCLPWLPFFQGVCSGIVRGAGRQRIGVLINFLSYFVALSVGITLMFFVFHESAGKKRHVHVINSLSTETEAHEFLMGFNLAGYCWGILISMCNQMVTIGFLTCLSWIVSIENSCTLSNVKSLNLA